MSDRYVATLASTSPTAATTTTQLKAGGKYSLQGDAAFYVNATKDGTAVTAATGLRVEANALFDVDMRGGEAFLSVLAVSGTANVKVFSVLNF